MSFNFGIINLPNNQKLINDLADACQRLEEKLSQIDFFELNITDYNKKYINQMIGTPDGLVNTLRKYAFVLSWALNKKYGQINLTFLDYGAGHGLMSMLAKELGIKNVVVSDIFGPSMDDAKELAKTLNLSIDHFIVGDITETLEYLNNDNISIDVISNYDTIEHIYRIDDFINALPKFGKNINYFFGSGANGCNPFINKKLRNYHYQLETTTREKSIGQKERDTVKAYIDIRKEIILENHQDINEADLEKIVRLTRGKRKDDILKDVAEFKATGKLPEEIPETTDTCDPTNGNWAEHIMDPFELNKKFEQVGFKNTFVLAGFYGKPKKLVNKIAGFFFNMYIKIMPTKLGLKLAPYYAIYGELNSKR